MPTIRSELVVVALGLGVLALVLATAVATRHAPAVRGGRIRGAAPVVPWVGSVLVVVLLVRGSPVGAIVVAAATFLHAGVTRWRAVVASRRRP